MKRFLDRIRNARARTLPPFPEEWRRLLGAHFAHYRRLPPDVRLAFERAVQQFATKHRITGIEIEMDDELRLLVSASAATLSACWPEYGWAQVAEVLVYADDFDRDFAIGTPERAGVADRWGTVVISAPALRASFDDPDDGYHVGLHEFAHLLDVEQTRFDGVPTGLRTVEIREWLGILTTTIKDVSRGRSPLDPYGGSGPVEFFAVAVEAFFERPVLVRRCHQRLYDFLRGYFGQDPAAWEKSAARSRTAEPRIAPSSEQP